VPLTVPSHGGLVAPLLLVDRGRLDGVALVVGATAPDLPYAWSRTAATAGLVAGCAAAGRVLRL
jgi:Domain of unknown function (DUF4184)